MGVQAISTGSWEDVLGVRYWTGTQWVDAFDPRMNAYYYRSRPTESRLSDPDRRRWFFGGFRSRTRVIPTTSSARGSVRTNNLKIVNLHILISQNNAGSSRTGVGVWTCEIDGTEVTSGVRRSPDEPLIFNTGGGYYYIIYPLPSELFTAAATRGFTMTRGVFTGGGGSPEPEGGYTYVSAVSA